MDANIIMALILTPQVLLTAGGHLAKCSILKYGLDCTIYFDRKRPVIHVRSSSMSTFRAILPYPIGR